jgi:selenocysteine-specific elongation factor
VFVLKGHGVVVTGTAAGGTVSVGDEVVVAPRGSRARVREVQVHGRSVPRAWAGQRVALNLASVGVEAVTRGDTVVAADAAGGTRRFDARVEVCPAARRPVRSHERVRLHLGTAEHAARIVWLGGASSVAPRHAGLAQVVLTDAPVVTAPGDRFVLRDETGSRTVGGGSVLLVDAPRHRPGDVEAPQRLAELETADVASRINAYLELCGELGSPVPDLARGVGMETSDVARVIANGDRFVRLGAEDSAAIVVARGRYERYTRELLTRVREHHATVTSASGIESERLRQTLTPRVDARLFRVLIDRLCGDGLLERRGGLLAEPSHVVRMSARSERAAEALLAELRQAGSTPPSLAELAERHRLTPAALQEVLGVLVERGQAVKVSSELYFATDAVEQMGQKLRRFLEQEGRITPARFRDLIEASRKYTIPLLDYFDRSGLTVRSGDYRRLQ